MKKTVFLAAALSALLLLSACNPLANRLMDAAKSAAAAVSPAHDKVIAEDTAEPEQTSPLETAAAEETSPPDTGVKPGNPPEDLPAWIPPFNAGTYVEEGSGKIEYGGSAVYTTNYAGVTLKQIDGYADALKNAGFETYRTEMNGDVLLTAQTTKDNLQYTALVGFKAADKTCSAVYTVAPKAD